jgi:transcriptional regulator with XRE-family HTH domain
MKITTWEARANKNISLRGLARLTGISKSTLNRIENEKKSPTLIQMEKIANALDLKISDLYESEFK